MWGTYFWWIFPAIGLLLCLAMMAVMAFLCIRSGCAWMPGNRRP
jgi:hypothetical protein